MLVLLHECIGGLNRACQNLFSGWVVEMMERKVEHSALFPLRPAQSRPLYCIYRLLNVRDVLTPARDSLPGLDIWPQIRKHKPHAVQTGGPQLLIHALLDKRCRSAGASASVNKCVLRCVLGTAQLVEQDFAGLYSGGATVGQRHPPRADESLMGVLAQPGRTPRLIFDLC